MIISEQIFKILKQKGISQKEFSEQTGISQSTISDWKHKKSNPASDKIMVICDVLEITPYELLSGTKNCNEKQVEYILVEKQSAEYRLLDNFRKLNESEKNRVIGYMEALSGR